MRKIFNGSAENGKFNLRCRLNGNADGDNGNINDRRIHLAMREHGDRAFVAGLVRIFVDQLVQRRTRCHGVQEQHQANQQGGEH